MLRSVIHSILIVLFIVGGLLCVAADAWQSRAIAHQPEPLILGWILLLLGGAATLTMVLSLRRQSGALVEKIREMTESSKLRPLESQHMDLRPLVWAMNDLIDMADQSVADASRQVKELEIQLKVATAERQEAQAIIYSISDAVVVTDQYDELVLANDAAARLFGFEIAKALRQPMDQVLGDPKMIDIIRDVRQSRSAHGRRIVEHQIRAGEAKEGSDKTFKVTLSCVTDQFEKPAGVVAVLHDMTREKEVADMKTDFVSSVSHELRTPLASIKAYIEMLIDGEADDEKTKTEFYEVIQSEANRLSRLIDNILNISRIESGRVQINKQPQSLTVILKEAMEVISPQARSKQITLTEKLTPIFYQTLADKDTLYQAVLNLLSNAVKYTPEGGQIVVETSVDEKTRKVVTRIIDSGVGIPAKDLPLIFDKFYRVEANSHMAKGTGLGLSLVQHIIQTVHNGRMIVESQVDKGSCFGFELELAGQ